LLIVENVLALKPRTGADRGCDPAPFMGDEPLEHADVTSAGNCLLARRANHPCARDVPKKKKPGEVTGPGFEES